MTPKATYVGKMEDLFLAWQVDELEIDIVENPIVNRGRKNGFMTGQDAAMRVFQVLCPCEGENEGQFNPVSVEEGEDDGLLVNKCVLKTLVYGEHQDEPTPEQQLHMRFVKLLDGPPPAGVQPHEGWMWIDGPNAYLCDGERTIEMGMTGDQVSAYVDSQVSSKAEISTVNSIGQNLNALSNSLSGYYPKTETSSSVQIKDAIDLKQNSSDMSSYYRKSETSSSTEIGNALGGKADISSVPTTLSELDNDVGFITSSPLSNYYVKSETSSATEISTALEGKQGTLTDGQDFALCASLAGNRTAFRRSLPVDFYCNLSGTVTSASFDNLGTITEIRFGSPVTVIGNNAFRGCSSLQSVELNDGIKSIRSNAFRESGLSSINLPEGLTSMGGHAFWSSKLTSIETPGSMLSVGETAFGWNGDLKKVKFNEGILSIDSYAMRMCSTMTDVEFPKSLKSLGYGSLMQCYGLSSVVFKGRTMEEVSAMANYPWQMPISCQSSIRTENEATKEWVESQISSNAELSDVEEVEREVQTVVQEMQNSRGKLDLSVYVDPLADVQDTEFKFTVAYAGDPGQVLWSGTMVHPGDESGHTWKYRVDEQACTIYEQNGVYTFMYYGFQDGGGNPHDGTITTDLAAPTWTDAFSDNNFHFTVTTQDGILATQKWVLAQLSALQARITELENS